MRTFSLPKCSMVWADDPNDGKPSDKPKLSKEDRLKKLQQEDNEVYSLVFGKGLTKGKNEVTDEHLRKASDDRYDKTIAALRHERIHRVIREKAKALNFMNPEDAVMFLAGSLTLNDEFEVIKKDDNTATTIDESLKQLMDMSPHLVKSRQKSGEGSSRPAPYTADSHKEKPTFKRSQLQDERFYAEHKDEIMLAAKENRIIDDIPS